MPDAVGFICHARVDVEHGGLRAARARLEERGFRVWTHRATRDERPGVLSESLNGTRLLVSLGGDGTLLWTAQQGAAGRIPVLGVNAGRLGFLTEVQLNDVSTAVERWASGDFTLERRPLLEAEVTGKNERFLALNDAVVHKGAQFNLIRLEVHIDGALAGRFDADGAVVSTATGSTGYALSLGGPIVHPGVHALVFMPLNPHSLFNRPVLIAEKAQVSIRLLDASGILSCDGQTSAALGPKSEVRVALAGTAVELVRFLPERNFFELLRDRLRWGQPLTDGA